MGEGEKTRPTEKFTCVYCAFFWWTNEYCGPYPFRRNYVKITSKCPRCGVITEKPIDEKDSDKYYKGEK